MGTVLEFKDYYDKDADALKQLRYLQPIYKELLGDILEFCGSPNTSVYVLRSELVPTEYHHVYDWFFEPQKETESIRAEDLLLEVQLTLSILEKVLKEY